MSIRIALVFFLAAMSAAATAEEPAVYESFSGVKIGRVFLAPGDRDRLDERRLTAPAEGTAEEPGSASSPPTTRALPAAGYIISSSGRASVWRDGDFVESPRQAPKKMAFPGDVEVTRTVAEDAANAASEEDQRARNSEGDDEAG